MKRHPLHDYGSAAGYFITFSTVERRKLLGKPIGGEIRFFECGLVVQHAFEELPVRFPATTVDIYQIMPDHVHCVLIFLDPRVVGVEPGSSKGLSAVMQWLKGSTARKINLVLASTGNPVWQKGYYERVIRSYQELDKFRKYIDTNPIREFL